MTTPLAAAEYLRERFRTMTRAEFEETARKYSPELLGLPREPDLYPPQSQLPNGRAWSDDLEQWLTQLSVSLDQTRLRRWDQAGLTLTKLRVLGELRRRDGLRVMELADRVGISGPSMSFLLGRLERGGFIRREISPAHGRGINVYLEPAGRAAIGVDGDELRHEAAGLLTDMTKEQLECLTRAFAALAGAEPVAPRTPIRKQVLQSA